MKNTNTYLLTALCTAIAPAIAQADTIEQTLVITESVIFTEFPGGPGNTAFQSIEWTINGFDSNLGTLDSIEIVGTIDMLAEFNPSPGGGGSFNTTNQFFVNFVQAFSGGGGNGSASDPEVVLEFPYSIGGQTGPVTESGPILGDGTDFSLSYSEFISPGTLAFWVDLQHIVTVGGTTINLTRQASELTLVYNYTPVPEPGSLALVALGGLSLMARRRRNR